MVVVRNRHLRLCIHLLSLQHHDIFWNRIICGSHQHLRRKGNIYNNLFLLLLYFLQFHHLMKFLHMMSELLLLFLNLFPLSVYQIPFLLVLSFLLPLFQLLLFHLNFVDLLSHPFFFFKNKLLKLLLILKQLKLQLL